MFRDKPCVLQLSELKMANQAERVVPCIIIDSFLSYSDFNPGLSYLDGVGLSGIWNSTNVYALKMKPLQTDRFHFSFFKIYRFWPVISIVQKAKSPSKRSRSQEGKWNWLTSLKKWLFLAFRIFLLICPYFFLQDCFQKTLRTKPQTPQHTITKVCRQKNNIAPWTFKLSLSRCKIH